MNVLIIMGRSFLATCCSIINVAGGELITRVLNESMVINVFELNAYWMISCHDWKRSNLMVGRRKKRQKSKMKHAY